MKIIDLRSDTVTLPTPAMRRAMAEAEVGDDVYEEDPTINRLQELGARKLGKEAGLFVPSGTMGNLAATLAHCGRGDEAIMGDLGHTFLFEAGGISALGGVFAHTLPNQPDGTLDLDDIRGAIRDPQNVHYPISRLVILENTHNRCGGVILPREYMQSVGDLAHAHGMKLHLDGARIFNAAVGSGVTAAEIAGPADSVTFCLSKGLCAPVGSVLCGTKDFICTARRIRKQLGGGMRQAGVLAAAGIVALETMVDRLAEDHAHASRLASELARIPGMRLDLGMPQTNMVFPGFNEDVKANAAQVVAALEIEGIKISAVGAHRFRLVTHYWIDDDAVERVVTAFRSVMSRLIG
jgi:threonine aldolase